MLRKILLVLPVLIWASSGPAEMLTDAAWVARYNGPGNDNDYAHAISLDDSGNVYVTGCSHGSTTREDYTTIKYDRSGNEVWTVHYDGPGSGWDEAFDLALDPLANVYVTGRSAQNPSGPYNYDYATVKYDSSGNELWVRRYNGSANRDDEARAIEVDNAGNVYVTGSAADTGTSDDYVTIKYDSDGNQLWVRKYDGPTGSSDLAYALTVDEGGNVCVAGESWGGGATDWDYAVVKYDSVGNQLWEQRYDGLEHSTDYCNDVAVDQLLNVYVTGWSYCGATDYDYVAIKYDSAGDELWAQRYNGPGNGEDVAGFVAVDDSGNVCVAGASLGTGTGYDYATVKYDPSGNEVWVERYNGYGTGTDVPGGLIFDDAGYVYVTGTSIGMASGSDYATIKYDFWGKLFWVRRYNGEVGSGNDGARAIAVDDSGCVYVTGSSYGFQSDYATVKYVETGRWRGDANGDSVINGGDIVYLINYLFRDGPAPDPVRAGDTNCTCGEIGTGDIVVLISYLYRKGPPPDCES